LFILTVLVMMFMVINKIEPVMADDVNTTAEVENIPPYPTSVELNFGTDIELEPGITTEVLGTAIIIDENGCDELQTVIAVLFRSDIPLGVNASDDGRNHYSGSCFSQGDCVDTSETYHCEFSVQHYADATDAGSNFSSTNWTFWIMPYDLFEGTSGIDQQEIQTLTSLVVTTTSMDFGAIPLGGNTSGVNEQIDVENQGNEHLDIELSGYGISGGDGYSMGCTLGEVNIDKLEYSISPFTYGLGIPMTSSSTEIDFDLRYGSDSGGSPGKSTYFGMGFPSSGIGGTCSGTVSITAVSDPDLD